MEPVTAPVDLTSVSPSDLATELMARMQSQNIGEEFVTFFLTLLDGSPYTIRYKLPTVKEQQQVNIFGRSVTFTEEVVKDMIILAHS